MNNIQKHYEEFANNYDNEITKIVPEYNTMLDRVVELIKFDTPNIKILDMGCGTGNLTKQIKEKYPESSIHCVDITEQMVQTAENKLAESKRITFEVCDLKDFVFNQTFQVVVAVLVLQNIQITDKKIEFYKRIFDSLSDGGLFIAGAIGLGETQEEQDTYIKNWVSFMSKNASPEKAQEVYKKYQEKDHPNKFSEEIQWLKDVGFSDARITWQQDNFAVFYGKKA